MSSTASFDDGPNADVGGTEPRGEVAGLYYDPDTGDLRYDFWEDQLRVLYSLNAPEQRRRDLQYLYRDITGEWIDDPYPNADDDTAGEWDIVGALGGYRSGKTTVGSRWIISRALSRPGTRWLAMAQDFQKGKKTTYKVLYQNLPGELTHILTSEYNGPEHSPIVRDFNRQDKILTLVNNTQIVLGSADDPGRHAGDEFNGVWLDEPSLYGSDLHQIRRMVGSRLSAGPPAVQLWTYTGNGRAGNAAYDIMERRVDEEEDPLSININVIKLSVLRNPFISTDTKRGLVRQYEGTGREEQGLYGGYAAARGLVYSGFSRNTHVVPEVEAWEAVADTEFRMYGYDAGWSDPRVLLTLGRNPYGQLIVLDEYYQSEKHVEHAVRWLQGGLPETDESPEGVIWSEHEPSDIQKFRKAGYRAVRADKSLDAGISDVRKRLGTDSRGRVGLLISDACENLIREIQDYQTEEVGTKSAEDHAVDALRYAVRGYESVDLTDSSGSGSSVERS
jgi:hypothetical protein